MKKIFKWLVSVFAALKLLRGNIKNLLLFEVIYRTLTVLVFFPLLRWAQRLLLVVNRTSSVTEQNMTVFFRNPLTWVVLLLLGLMITVFALFERFCIVDALHASRCRVRKTARQMISTGFSLIVQRFRPGNLGLIFYTLIVIHFGGWLDVSGVTSIIKIPGFLREEFEKYPYKNFLYVAAMIGATYLFLRWIFTIPIMMESDGVSFRKARQKSWRMTRGSYVFSLLILMVFWLAFITVLFFASALVIVVIWYGLSLWLETARTPGIVRFFSNVFTPTATLFYVFFEWLTSPLILASYQSAYYKRKEQLGEQVLPYTEEPRYLKMHPVIAVLFFACMAVTIFFSGPSRYAQLKWMLNTKNGAPLIMAHRGYSKAAPENTIPAFQMCIDEGFTAAELDVQMTADGEIICLHDSNLKRTTGLNRNVWEVTYDEIRDLDNGSFFSKKFADTRIPTLDEVLKLCKDKLYLNIEIKRNGHDEGIVERVVELIEENDYFDQCDVTSKNYATLEEVKAINPNIETAYTSVIGLGKLQDLEAADIISIQETFATYENVDRLHTAGKRVFVWTVNEESTMRKLVPMNVDAILTNNPALCKEVIDEFSDQVMSVANRVRDAFSFVY